MGVGGFVVVFILANLLVAIVALSSDGGFEPTDIGNAFEKMNAVAHYADQRLGAAANANPLPAPPRILADQGALQLGMLATLVTQVLLFGVVGIASKQHFRGLVEALGLNSFQPGRIWLIFGGVIAAYLGTAGYSILMDAINISWLQPTSTVPTEISRNDFTLSIAAVVTLIGAPISEELFFRGLMFSGLLKWGFWPAAMLSGFMFATVHFDPGSLIPFVGIATLMSWLYWRKGCLWDSILFHLTFNALSFAFLVTTR
ncbi:MAG: CPBP family intramembrane glutamic endopeptidase [bacterium]